MADTTIHDILAEFRDAALNNRDLGDKFERLICRYLTLDPQYAERFSNVWLWNEWPRKGEVGDIGIDIVAEEEATDDIVGIQCKFYLPEHQLSKGDIDKFLATLGKKQFASGIIISTTDKWGSNIEHTIKDQSKPIQKLRVQDLDASPVDWSTFTLDAINKLKLQKKRDPRPHQKAAIKDVKEGFAEHDRGKLIMACGTGKTYTSLVNGKPALEWIMERYQYRKDPDSGIVNDPNDWCREHDNPRYIVDLLKRVTRVSIETMKIVNALPALNEKQS